VAQIFLTYKRRLNILHDTKRKFLSIKYTPRHKKEVLINRRIFFRIKR